MIEFFHCEDIDYDRWDNCVQKSKPALPYAYSWFLDTVTPGWSGLILNDYKAVMPLPVKRKAGISYSFQPPFCQQLGIFNTNSLDEATVSAFLTVIPRELRVVELNIHAETPKVKTTNITWSQRSNYILPLHSTYEDLYKNYSSNRQRDLAKAKKRGLTIHYQLSTDTLLQAFQENVKRGMSNQEKKTIAELIHRAKENQYGFTLSVWDENNLLHAGGFFIQSNGRFINLLPVTTALGRKSGAGTMLYDSLIRSYAESNTILDFEGSMIPSIAFFYASFGAEQEQYWRISRNTLIWPLNIAYRLYMKLKNK